MGQWAAFAGGRAAVEADALRAERVRFMNEGSLHIDVASVDGITSPFASEAYQEAVERIRDYIAAGDVFQVNLSQRQDRPTKTDSRELYEWLRLVNPSPYMGYIGAPDFQLVSASPELLVELANGACRPGRSRAPAAADARRTKIADGGRAAVQRERAGGARHARRFGAQRSRANLGLRHREGPGADGD